MPFRYLCCAFLGFFYAFQVNAASLQAINLADQQGILSQRIVKIYCQIALNISPEVSWRQLVQSIRDFEDNLKQLEKTANSRQARSTLTELRSAWEAMQHTNQGEFGATTASRLDRQADAVRQAAEQLATELQDQSTPVTSRWVNTAGRQRMLSQRLTKAYMLRQLGLDSASKRQELESASYEFSGAMSKLQKRPENSPAIRVALNDLSMQWEWLRAALAIDGASDYRLIVAEGSEAILETANRVTVLYSSSEQ